MCFFQKDREVESPIYIKRATLFKSMIEIQNGANTMDNTKKNNQWKQNISIIIITVAIY